MQIIELTQNICLVRIWSRYFPGLDDRVGHGQRDRHTDIFLKPLLWAQGTSKYTYLTKLKKIF